MPYTHYSFHCPTNFITTQLELIHYWVKDLLEVRGQPVYVGSSMFTHLSFALIHLKARRVFPLVENAELRPPPSLFVTRSPHSSTTPHSSFCRISSSCSQDARMLRLWIIKGFMSSDSRRHQLFALVLTSLKVVCGLWISNCPISKELWFQSSITFDVFFTFLPQWVVDHLPVIMW